MPSRTITIAIIAFWLVTIGWFVGRELAPHWLSDDPPTYTIELADEAHRHPIPIHWTLTYNGRNVGKIRTTLRYHESTDTFELLASSPELTFMDDMNLLGLRFSILIRDYDDRIRITRDGELRAMSMSAKLTVRTREAQWEAPFETKAWVQDGRLERRGRLEIPGQNSSETVLDGIDSPRGRVLNPMHPVPRIVGLRLGQQWRQPVIDPRGEIGRAVAAQQLHINLKSLPSPPKTLDARVLTELRELKWNGEMQSCLVIEYRGEDQTARTWVRQSDGTVLRQEAESQGESLVLQRD